MHNNTSTLALSFGIALVTWLGGGQAVGQSRVSAAANQSATQGDSWVLAVPKRRTADAPPAPPPPLPDRADSITPSTIDVVVRRQPGATRSRALRQRIVRTVDRIHVGDDGREWLFERNPIDPRRVAGTFVDHRAQAVILYEETDLRMALGIRGWADVLALGGDNQGHFSVERIRTGADATLLAPPQARFPRYRVYDLAGWLERH